MKTYRNLYPQICSFQNLLSAFWKARRHKSARPYVAAFEFDLERNLFRLEEECLINHNNGFRVYARYSPLRSG